MGTVRKLGTIALLVALVASGSPVQAAPVAARTEQQKTGQQKAELRSQIRCVTPETAAARRSDAGAPAPRAPQSAEETTSAYSALLTPQRMIPGEEYSVEVKVTNTTAAPLPKANFVLSYHWKLPDGTDYTKPSNRADTALPNDIAPGQSVTVQAVVKAPINTDLGQQRETFVLDWDLRDKHTDKWLSDTAKVPTLSQPVTAEYPTSDQLGLEKFYQYNGINAGTGWSSTVNQYSGNAVIGFNAYTNPNRGLSTFVRLNYNSLDNSNSYLGTGWSLTTSSLHRLGSPLQFHRPLLSDPDYPAKVTLIDGDGTSHWFELNKNGSNDKKKWSYDSPAGVHLHLARNGGDDKSRTWVMTHPDSTRNFFDADGYQTAIADKNNNELKFTYVRTTHGNRNTGVLTEITDTTGRRVLTLDYYQRGDDFFSFVDNVKVFGKNLTNTSITSQLRSITDISGRRTTFAYSDRGQLQEVVDGADTPGQKVVSLLYADPRDHDSKLVRINDALGRGTQVKYFEEPGDHFRRYRVQELVDRRGHTTAFDYSDPDGRNGESVSSTVTDPNRNGTTFQLDGFGRPVKQTNAKGEVTDLAWDADNNVRLMREHNGATTTWKYDPKTGFPLEIKDAEANAHNTAPTKLGYRTKLDGHTAELSEKTTPEGRKWTFGLDERGNLTSVTDPKGFVSKNEYDEFGQLKAATDANGHTSRFEDFDPTGYPRRSIDALGCVSTTAYDVVGNVVSFTDAKQKTSTYTYDIFKRPGTTRVPQDAAAGKFIVTPGPRYDQNDNVLEKTAPNGAVSTASYGAMDEITSVTTPKDSATGKVKTSTYEYDAAGNLVKDTAPEGTLTRNDDKDFATTFAYDQLNRLVETTLATGDRSTNAYDVVGNVVSETSPLGRTSRSEFDLNHRVTKVIDAAGHSTGSEYDRDGNVLAAIDQNGNRTVRVLDERAMVREVRSPHAANVERVSRFEYDAVGNKTKTITPKGVETGDDPDDFTEQVIYDELNRVKEKLAPFDKDDARVKTPDRTLYGYDEVGNLVETSAPPSAGQTVRNVTTNSYFDNGWLKSSVDPWNITATYEYNAIGKQTRRVLTAAGGSSTRSMEWEYTPDGKQLSRKDDGVPVGKDVLVVDNSDQAVEVKGEWGTAGTAGGDHEGFDYRTHNAGDGADTFSWLIDVPRSGKYEVFTRYANTATAKNASYAVEHDGGTETKQVDQTQQPGQWVSLGSFGFTEDAVKKITLSDQANGTVVADAVKVVRDGSGETDDEQKTFGFSYDANDNLVEMTDSSSAAKVSRYAVAYTQLDQIKQVQEIGAESKVTSYTYDADGNPKTREHPSQSSSFEYDVRNLITKVTNTGHTPDAKPQVASFEYDARRQVLEETKANGNVVGYEYFLDGMQRHYAEKKPDGTLVNEHTVEYDANGQRTKDIAKTMNADNNSAYLDRTLTYEYDPVNRLRKQVKSDPAGKELETESYVHDANGNVVEQTLEGKTTKYTFDRNRVTSASVDGQTARHSYDPFGRLDKVTALGKTIEKYRYDGFDRIAEQQKLKNGSTDLVTIKFAYDPIDRTTTRTEGGKTTDYAYLGLSSEVLTEQLGGKLTKSYQHSPNGRRLSQTTHKDDGTTEQAQFGFNPHTDVELLTDDSGNTKSTYGYTAYGKDDEESFTGIDKPDAQQPGKEPYNFYRFNGKRWDSTTGSYDMGFRDYNPGLNRFLTRDSYNGALADLQLGTSAWTGNRYAFTGGNPISRVEIDGHCWAWDWICDTGDAVGDAANATGNAIGDAFSYMGDHIDDIGGMLGGAGMMIGGGLLIEVSAPLLVAPAACATGVLCAPGLAGGALGVAGILTGGGIMAGGAALFAQSVGGLFESSPGSSSVQQPDKPRAPEDPNIAKDNWRGRYNADLGRQGKPRLPDDWDAHHAIPQEYRNHPEFKDFDFDAPSNIRGVPGSRTNSPNHGRADNHHQDITNRWADFGRQNPNANRSQIEDFARRIDEEFGGSFWYWP
ncbi:RHS repeat-associated core domain-containing protein [Lentzea sp. NPDC005914]|uniref:golvesin C-terminal-like domain-containing protein n=1 Tax=Lentzea sp. NPDC005914 TaxID=3154572 RepID=UPI0033D3345B